MAFFFQVQANCASYMNVGYLAQLIRDNPLSACEKFVLDSPGSDLGQPAMELLINSLPALRNRMLRYEIDKNKVKSNSYIKVTGCLFVPKEPFNHLTNMVFLYFKGSFRSMEGLLLFWGSY